MDMNVRNGVKRICSVQQRGSVEAAVLARCRRVAGRPRRSHDAPLRRPTEHISAGRLSPLDRGRRRCRPAHPANPTRRRHRPRLSRQGRTNTAHVGGYCR